MTISFIGILSRMILILSIISCFLLLIQQNMIICTILFLISILLLAYHPIKSLIKSIEHKSVNFHVIINNKMKITDIYKQGKLKNKFVCKRGWDIKRFLLENFSNETSRIIINIIQNTEIGETNVKVLPQYKHIFINTAIKVHKLKKKIICSFSQGQNYWTDGWIYHVLNKHPIPCCIVNESGKILFSNKALCQWLGHSETDIKAQNFWDLCYDEANELKLFNFRSNNSIKQALLCHSFSWNEPNISGLCWAPIDHNNIFNNHTIWNFFPIPIIIFDEKGLLIECNYAFKMSHSSDIQWHKEKMNSIFSNSSHILKKVLNTPLETYSITTYLSAYNVHMKGKWHFLYIPSSEQDIIISCFQSENISPESDKLQSIGKLSTSIAHDFNNLLTAITGFCDIALEKHMNTPSYADLMQIKNNAMRAINLVRHMLSFSKDKVSTINIYDAINTLEPLLKKLIGGLIQLNIEIVEKNIFCMGQSDFLDQILLNLVINARDAISGCAGTINIIAKPIIIQENKFCKVGNISPGKYIHISVQDSGKGIDISLQDKIFDPFFSTKAHQGTGLGLSTVSNLIIKNNCALEFNTQKNIGTTFNIYIPQTETKENIIPIEKAQYNIIGKLHILLIEDEDPIRLLIKQSLLKHNFDVIALRDAHNAEKKLESTKIDLLITDIMLPGMNGTVLVRKVLSKYPAIKVLFVSGYSQDNVMKGETFSNRVYFLEKPFTPEQLIDKIHIIISNK